MDDELEPITACWEVLESELGAGEGEGGPVGGVGGSLGGVGGPNLTGGGTGAGVMSMAMPSSGCDMFRLPWR